MQHPEVEGMPAEDYDYLISNPYDCLLERVIPRLYTNLDLSDPVNMAKTLAKSCLAFDRFLQEGATATAGLVEVVDWNFEPIEMPVIKRKYFTALDSDDTGDKAVYEFEERMFDYFMRLLV
ncbi:MAG: hypothetical protein QM368_02020 [Bacillota bacterium]|nr:hypothetical protein [Bacillota bacterium]